MPIPPELASACADVALAGGADAIGNRQARYVAAPASPRRRRRCCGRRPRSA